MPATGLQLDANNRTAGLGFLVEDTAAGPYLCLEGGVRAESGGMAAATTDAGAAANDYVTLARIELGLVTATGSGARTAQSASWQRNVLTYGTHLAVTASRLTPALKIATDALGLSLLATPTGTVVHRRVADGSTVSAVTTGKSYPKWLAYHTAAGYQTHKLVPDAAAFDLSAMDQPWLLVWYGTQEVVGAGVTSGSHFAETSAPLTYSHSRLYAGGARGFFPGSLAYQADAPLLLMFGAANPATVAQTSAAGGLDLAFSVTPGNVVLLPLYGREHPAAATTDGWGTALPAAVQTRVSWWVPRLYRDPETAARTVTATTTSATVTDTFTYTTVHTAAGSDPAQIDFAPLPPAVGIALHTGWAQLTVTGSTGDGTCPTAFGPVVGVTGTSSAWTLSGLGAYTAQRAAPGGGTRTAALQATLDNEIDRLCTVGATRPLAPWYPGERPANIAGDLYGANPADVRSLLAECVPLASTAQATALKAYLSRYETAYPLASSYQVLAASATNADPGRGAYATTLHTGSAPATRTLVPESGNFAWMTQTAQTIWNAWAQAREAQVGAYTLAGTEYAAHAAVWGAYDTSGEAGELDWATGNPFAGKGDRPTPVEDCNRRCAGLLGLYYLAVQQGTATNQQDALAAFAVQAVLRVAMGHYPRWLAAVGSAAGALLTYPTALYGASWLAGTVGAGRWDGNLQRYTWTTSADDPRQVATLDQFGVHLDDSSHHLGVSHYVAAHLIAYRDLTPPVAQVVVDALGAAEATIYADAVQEIEPHWYLPFAFTTVGGEHGTHVPADSQQVFLAEAWLRGTAAATLATYTGGTPWLSEGGDEHYLSKVAEVLRAEAAAASAGPVFSSVVTPATATQWARWEATFALTTVATNVYYAYDAAPPGNVTAGSGISVDALVTEPDGVTTHTVPCCWIGAFSTPTTKGARDWFQPIPDATNPAAQAGAWTCRIAFPTAGAWTVQLQATDAGGTSTTTAATVTVSADAAAKGHVQRSPTDTHWFRYADGTPLPGWGINFRAADDANPVTGNSLIAALGTNAVRSARFWPGNLWGAFGDFAQRWEIRDPVLTPTWGDSSVNGGAGKIAPGAGELAWNLYNLADPTAAWNRPVLGSWRRPTAIERSTPYRLQVEYAIPLDLQPVPGTPVGQYGFTVKEAGYLNNPDPWRYATGTNRITPLLTAATAGWTTATATFTTGSTQDWIEGFWLTQINCQDTSGTAGNSNTFVRSVALQKDNGDGTYGPNLLSKPTPNGQQYVDQSSAYRFERILEQCETAGIALCVILSDKGDQCLNVWDATTGVYAGNDPTLVQFYGPLDQSITKSRWLLRQWWRYAQARWGYSSAIHSWEVCNEMSHFSGNADQLTIHFTSFMHAYTLNGHLCTTSWDSGAFERDAIPTLGVDYATLHPYLTAAGVTIQIDDSPTIQNVTAAQPGDDADTVRGHTDVVAAVGGTVAIPIVRAEVGIHDPAQPDLTTLDPNAVWLENLLFAQFEGTVWEWYFWDSEHLFPGGNTAALAHYLHASAALAGLPLDNGLYAAAAATASGDGGLLRVLGRKDTTNGRAHLLVNNSTRTTGTVQAGTVPTTISGASLTVTGLPAGPFTVTVLSTVDGSTVSTQTVTSS